MLISNLGKTRTKLLNSFRDLTDDQLNKKAGEDTWSIAQVLHHLYTSEKETAALIMDSLETKSEKVGDKDLSFLTDRSKKAKATIEPPSEFYTKKELVQLLEESRFQHLQYVFNETHERILAEKSMEHPAFGVLSLKNLVDFIWLHEKRHTDQIYEIKQWIV